MTSARSWLVVDVADGERVELRAGIVVRPGEAPMVGRMHDAADAEIGVALGERVAVEQDRFSAAGAHQRLLRMAHVERMLAALDVSRRIGERAVGRRNRRIVLLDAPAHLLEERLLQLFGVRHRRGEIGVLRLEIGADIRRQQRPDCASPPASFPPGARRNRRCGYGHDEWRKPAVFRHGEG